MCNDSLHMTENPKAWEGAIQPARPRQHSSARLLSIGGSDLQASGELKKNRLSRLERRSTIQEERVKRTRWIWLATALVIVSLIALIVPLAVILPRRNHKELGPAAESTIIVPLYIYPGENAWEPLYQAVSSHQNLTFLVVVNPDNGPGNTSLPDDTYVSSIQKLNSYSNVRTLGYVRTTGATRNVSDVLADISTYNGWANSPSVNGGKRSLAMSGIFFDEAPIEYSEAAAAYLVQINTAVKAASGIQRNKTVIHNPGTISDTRLRVSQTDILVVVENTYAEYKDDQYLKKLEMVQEDKSGISYMVHSVPDRVDMQNLVDDVSQRARYIFMTDLSTNYYESFGRTWQQFVDAMAR